MNFLEPTKANRTKTRKLAKCIIDFFRIYLFLSLFNFKTCEALLIKHFIETSIAEQHMYYRYIARCLLESL
jgi:hypothetical protein